MATPPTPSADLTRHQLDELDALLQRMLNLPLAAPAAPPVLPTSPPAGLVELPPDWRADGAVAPRVPHVAPETEPELPNVLPSADRFAQSGLARQPASVNAGVLPPPTVEVEPARTLRGVDAPALPAGFAPALPPAADAEPVTLVSVMPPAPPTVPLLAWPFAAVNAGFEAGLGKLGPAGQMLTGARAKNLLGLAGVTLIGLAGWWAARGAQLVR